MHSRSSLFATLPQAKVSAGPNRIPCDTSGKSKLAQAKWCISCATGEKRPGDFQKNGPIAGLRASSLHGGRVRRSVGG